MPWSESNYLHRQWRQSNSGRESRATELRPTASSASPSASTSSPSEPEQPRALAAGASANEERKQTFLTRVMKPLQDFGFGKMSFMEGGVGLFVFAGVGALTSTYS